MEHQATQPEQPQETQETPAEVGATAEPQANENRGAITELGEQGMEMLNAPQNLFNDAVAGINNLVPEDSPLKGITQTLDDAVMGAEEYSQAMAEASPVGAAIAGGIEGTKAGILSPVTIAGRLSNQDTPWSRAPGMIKDNDIAETVFNIAEIVVPTAFIGIATGGAGLSVAAPTTLLAESALETGLQDNVDDLIAGRQLAVGLGTVGDYMGLDGASITRDLIEGRKPEAKYFNSVVGFLQNLGINFGVNKVMSKFFPDIPNPPAVNEEAAGRVLGKTPEEVQASVSNVTERQYTLTLLIINLLHRKRVSNESSMKSL